MNRWLSLLDVCVELRLGERAVRKLLRTGQLVGYQLPRQGRRRGEWRILDPGDKFARYLDESQRHIQHIPLASTREFAEVLGVKPATIRQWKRRRKIAGEQMGGQTLYPASEVRRVLFSKNLSASRGYSPILVRWLTGIIERDRSIGGDVLDGLLRQALPLPEPEKSKCIVELWSLFDRVNEILNRTQAIRLSNPNLS